jgi:16S rRNA (guanine966-N2)-methyltransferase
MTTQAQLRIVAGDLKGRQLMVAVHPGMRPTPQAVREALFSILGPGVAGRPFFDVFAGTGINGLEALSRGATRAVFVERDGRLAGAIDSQLSKFRVADRGVVVRGDVYRWAERWLPPNEPVNIYLSPPFPDLTKRADEFHNLVATLQRLAPADSVLALQLETGFEVATLPDPDRWDVRKYGRNLLAFWEPAARAAELADGGAGGPL